MPLLDVCGLPVAAGVIWHDERDHCALICTEARGAQRNTRRIGYSGQQSDVL
jgi:hypothetical protein